jgi:hypothetical protein
VPFTQMTFGMYDMAVSLLLSLLPELQLGEWVCLSDR